MPTTKTFIAIPVDAPALHAIQGICRRLASQLDGVRWADPTHLHLTVRFLGDVNDLRLPEACNRVEAVARDFEPLTLTLNRLGTFPVGKPAKVLWLGMAEEPEQLHRWHEELGRALADLDIPHDGRAFRPHLTLGRVQAKANAALHSELAEQPPGPSVALQVDELVVMASRRERGKLTHERIATVPLV